MARLLNPGGVLVIDGWVRPDVWRDRGQTTVDVATADPAVKVVRVVRSERTGSRTVLEMHYLIATADQVEHVVEHHRLMMFEHEAYEAAFSKAGLEVEVLESPVPGRDRDVGRRTTELLT